MVDDQLHLPLPRAGASTDPGHPEVNGRVAGFGLAPELVAFRSRSPLWELAPSKDRHLTTVREVLDRVRLLGVLRAGRSTLRDEGAPLFAAALELAARSPWAVRLARDHAGLHSVWTHAGVDLPRVEKALAEHPGAHPEMEAVVEVLARLRERMARASIVDGATALALGLEAVKEGQVPPSLRRYARVVFHHWVDPTELELSVVLALAHQGLPVELVLPLDADGNDLAPAVAWIERSILANHRAEGLELRHELIGERSATRAFCTTWGRPLVQSAALMADVPVRVEVARDPAAEARRIAGVVAAWAHGSDPMPRIAVGLRTLDGHADRIEDALRSYGLPVMRRDGRRLSDTPPGLVLSELLRLRRDGVPRDRLLALLTQPAFKHARPVDEVGLFAAVLRRAAARTDVEDQSHPTGGYRHRLERFIGRQAQESPAEAEEAARALAAIEEVLALLGDLPRRASLDDFLARTKALVDRAIDPAADEEAFRRLRELLSDSARSLSRVTLEDDAPRVVELAAFRRLLLRALAEVRLPPVPHRAHHAVELAELPQLLGRTFDHVVIADCVHGRLPQAERDEPLLTDGDRARVRGAMPDRRVPVGDEDLLAEPSLAPRQLLEPLWFLGAAAAARESLLITAAGRDMRGREIAPSPYLEDALLALGLDADAQAGGPEPPFLPHPQKAKLSAVYELHRRGRQGPLTDEERMLVERFDRMAAERRAFFQRDPKVPAAEAVAPFAYAVDAEVFEARFGFLLGLTQERPLSPTRLESFAACRFRGFVEQMLRIDTELAAGQDADARALGKLAHAVLERFYKERAERDADPAVIDVGDQRRIRALVEELAADMREGRETGHLAALDANVRWLATSLTRTVTLLAQEPPVPGAKPYRFELNIGTPSQAKPKVADAVPLSLGERTLFIGGEIDRVDRSESTWVVVDYKNSTGAKVRAKVREKELLQKHFQLPLYLRLIASYVRLRPTIELAAYLISLRDGVASDVLGENVGMRRRVTDDTAPDGLAAGVGRVVLPLLDGRLPADEGPTCRGCRVARVCRRPQAGAGLVGSAGAGR